MVRRSGSPVRRVSARTKPSPGGGWAGRLALVLGLLLPLGSAALADEPLARPAEKDLPPPTVRRLPPRGTPPPPPPPPALVPAPRAPAPPGPGPGPGPAVRPPIVAPPGATPPPAPRTPPGAPGTSSAREIAPPLPDTERVPPAGPGPGAAPPPLPSPLPPEPRAPLPGPEPTPGPTAPSPEPDLGPSPEAPGRGEPALDLGRGPPPRIARIAFEGNELFTAESLKTLMGLKEGGPLTEAGLDRDMALLARYFESARVVTRPAPGGVELVFQVEENPLVVQVRIYGAAEMSEDEVRELLSTKAGYPLFRHQLAADAAELVTAYRLKGYAFAHVPEPVVTTAPGGGRRVDFTIVEGPKVELERVVFRGGTSIPRNELLEVMQTKERGFWDFLSGPLFREDTLREDVVAIARLYQDEGYLDAEVALADLRFSDDKERAQATIAIEEHLPYTVGNVKVEIERPEPGRPGSPTPEDLAFLTEARLTGWLGLTPGQRWSGKQALRGRERIRDELYKRSYLDAAVREVELRGRERENVVDVTLQVRLGWKFRLRRIDFVGNEFTRDSWLRRELRVNPGGYVDRGELERGLARLRRPRYFSRVGMQLDDVPTPPGAQGQDGAWKDARFEIVEDKTGKLGFSVGVSTSGGLFGTISFQKRNFDIARLPRSWDDLFSGRAFTGNGQTFEAVVSPGTESTSFLLGFTEPRFFGSELAFGVRFYRRLEFRSQYSIDRLGYQTTLSYPVYRSADDSVSSTVGVRWRHEQAEVYEQDADAVPGAFLFDGYNELRGLRGYATLRVVDDTRRTRRSFEAGAGLELAGTFLGGDIDQLKLDANVGQTWTLREDEQGRPTKLALKAQVGWARALNDTPEVPPFERFFLGGNEFRGFANRGVGPHVFGNPTGGEWMLKGSLDLEQPLFGDTLSVALFVDFGTLGTALGESDAWRPRLAFGPGLLLRVPVLGDAPLAFYLGFVVLDEDDDERQALSFSLARDF